MHEMQGVKFRVDRVQASCLEFGELGRFRGIQIKFQTQGSVQHAAHPRLLMASLLQVGGWATTVGMFQNLEVGPFLKLFHLD